MIIDCHTHLGRLSAVDPGFAEVRDRLLCVMDDAGVDLAFVYPDTVPDENLPGMAETIDLVAGHPRLLAVGTTTIPFTDPDIVGELNRLAGTRAIVGIKLYPGFELFYPDDQQCDPVYDVCQTHDIPVVFHSGETQAEPWREQYNHPDRIAALAQRRPRLKIVVAHFSQPHLIACRDLLLSVPNVHADISGLAYPDVETCCGKETIVDVLAAVADRRPDKLLFGTDWPICDVNAHLCLVDRLPLSAAAKTMMLSGNAVRLFRVAEDGHAVS